MSKKLRIAQYGCGKMAVYSMRYVYEKGGEIVSAFDINPQVIGKDIGDIMKTGKKGIIVQNASDAGKAFKADRPDACIITTLSLFKDVFDAFKVCAENGVNAISTCEEAFYPQNSSPALTAQLDEIARKNNCTLCGSGYQDVFWGNLITVLAGATQTVKKIRGRSSYNVEDYGIALAKAHGAGLDLDAFAKEISASDNISEEARKKLIDEGTFLPSYMWNVNGWLCARLGLTPVKQVQKTVPQTYKADLKSSTLNMTIPSGHATGMSAVVTTETEEGIVIESESIGKVYAPEDFDQNDWTLEGEPSTQVIINRPATVELTCATVVGRLPDLINAEPGYVTTDKMQAPVYKLKTLDEYAAASR
ncbi:MAG: hypothetical protein LBR69_03945 [Endomicrobium sp.]|jgi:4-hydroxy-tetrahydrodipicolinate reductase|nr:hypothetical protein [Endomicrobium sp.]